MKTKLNVETDFILNRFTFYTLHSLFTYKGQLVSTNSSPNMTYHFAMFTPPPAPGKQNTERRWASQCIVAM